MIEFKVIRSTGMYELEVDLNDLLNKYSDIDVQSCVWNREWAEFTAICKCCDKEQQ